MTYVKKFFLLLIIFFLTSTKFSSASIGKNIFQKSSKSAVYIKAYDNSDTLISQGSGFYIEKNKIVTNFHVIKNSTYLLIYDINGKYTYCNQVEAFDNNKDIAILKSNDKANPLKINYKYTPDIGDNIFVISSPRGFKFTISDGILSGIRNINSLNLYQMTAPISPGSSGGAVLDEENNVIGIASSYFKDGQNINFSIPITYIKDLIIRGKPILLSEIEDPELALDTIFLTIFDKTYYGMPEYEFLDTFRGCKHISHERKQGTGSETLPKDLNSEEVSHGVGFFEALDEIIGPQNTYKINKVKVVDIYFDFTFTFSEKENNTLTFLSANSVNSKNSKYCYISLIEYLSDKFKKFHKISEHENNKRQQELTKQIINEEYKNFFVPTKAKILTTSWIIYDSYLSVTFTESQNKENIRISWIKNIFD
ncbi:MAG: serine protease [Desulfomicrobium sp.]|nr:serine protease [Pseudomonadota bacterium]MBV1710897.1 serine protease [Desulfomicrobium sp.]MBU4571524.1 serine protease [Pseudomonadota bacterium]MBU4594512.1 serine protease [Pseudomonadota bacterium]MBV1718630.1 serine protease [Desulfomicrobium sp.]